MIYCVLRNPIANGWEFWSLADRFMAKYADDRYKIEGQSPPDCGCWAWMVVKMAGFIRGGHSVCHIDLDCVKIRHVGLSGPIYPPAEMFSSLLWSLEVRRTWKERLFTWPWRPWWAHRALVFTGPEVLA